MQYEQILQIFGGLGLFLFGLKMMADGLQDLAGKNIKKWIRKATKTPIHGVLLGIIITGLLQTSSGSTALTIALVAGGMMTFKQAASVIVGANIGTTVTAFLIGVKISNHALLFIAVGGLVYLFAKKIRTKHLATSVLGFGLIFFGLTTMGSPLKEISQKDYFTDFVHIMGTSSPLALFMGAILTAIVQSSSAFIGIVQELYGQDLIGISVAIPFVLGANIGTTITAILASLGGSKAAKQAALFHTMVNIFAGLIALILMVPFSAMIIAMSNAMQLNPEMQLAWAHGIFNVGLAIIILPLLGPITNFIESKTKGDEIKNAFYLDHDVSHNSAPVAILVARKAVSEMAKVTGLGFSEVIKFFETKDKNAYDKVLNIEAVTDDMRSQMQAYLREIGELSLSSRAAKEVQWLSLAVKDIERVSDIKRTICKTFKENTEGKKKVFSDQAIKELKTMIGKIEINMKRATNYLLDRKYSVYSSAKKTERQIDALDLQCKKNHLKRVKDKICGSSDKQDYNIIISAIERTGDHIYNIFASYKAKKSNDAVSKVISNIKN